MVKQLWEWITGHVLWLAGGALGVLAAYYLLLRPSSGGPTAPTTVSFPAQGGGGGTGATLPPPASTQAPIPMYPYSPDFGILSAITDAGLRILYERRNNLMTQINQQTLAGNKSLVATLTGALQVVENQIANYLPLPPAIVAPPVAPPPVAPPPVAPPPVAPPPVAPPPSVTAAQVLLWQNTYFTGGLRNLATWIADAPTLVKSSFSYGQLSQIFDWFNYQAAQGVRGLDATTLINGWIGNPATIPTAPAAPAPPGWTPVSVPGHL